MMATCVPLPRGEVLLYFLVLVLALYWAGDWICLISDENTENLKGLQDGWTYFGRKMDVSDFEWVMWFTKFRNYILLVLSGHVLFGKIVSMVVPEYRALIYMTYGLLTVLALMGYQFVLLLVSHCFVLYTVALIKCRWLCFIAGLGSLASLKLVPFSSWQMDFALGNHQLQDVLYAGGLAFTIIRCMSFMLDNCDLVETNYSFLDLLKYNFYLPFFFFGPIMIYEDFHKQVQQLEQQKQVLEAQWRALQQRGGASVNVDGMFQSYINSLKQQLEGLGQDKMRLHGELQQMQGLVEDFKSKYEEEINNRTQKENEFVVVKKDVDDAYLAKVELEAKLDGLQDEIKFLKDIYAEEISQLEQQIKDTSLFVSVDTTRNLNVADIINESQRHYDDIAESSKREASRFYQEKLNEQVSCAPSGEDDIRKCRSEINELNQSMQHMKAEIENLKKRRANLEAQIAEAEEQGDVQIAETKAQITELEKDLHKCKDDMAAQLKEYHALMNVKLALDIEIATYRSLLEQEENRINSISYGGGGGGGGGLFGGIGGGIGGIGGGIGGLGGGIGGFGGSLGGSGSSISTNVQSSGSYVRR